MGCDGGTIPRRDELVKVKKKPEAKDKDAELAFKWRCCSITQQTLQPPIVACHLGRFYNKVSLIEALLNNRDALPECAKHIKSLKDVKNLNLTKNPTFSVADEKSSPYICPVIGLEMSGKFRFVALWTCGCVFSERALKEVKVNHCHKCLKPFQEDDIIILNPDEEDMPTMLSRMEKRKAHDKKGKSKKVNIKQETAADDKSQSDKAETNIVSSLNDVENKSKVDIELEPTCSGLTKGKSSKMTKRPVVTGSLTESSPALKKTKADYSVAKDPNATNVYKSLFTSHSSEKQQNRAHWITYNPFYN